MKTYTLDTNNIAYLMKGMYKLNIRLADVVESGDQKYS